MRGGGRPSIGLVLEPVGDRRCAPAARRMSLPPTWRLSRSTSADMLVISFGTPRCWRNYRRPDSCTQSAEVRRKSSASAGADARGYRVIRLLPPQTAHVGASTDRAAAIDVSTHRATVPRVVRVPARTGPAQAQGCGRSPLPTSRIRLRSDPVGQPMVRGRVPSGTGYRRDAVVGGGDDHLGFGPGLVGGDTTSSTTAASAASRLTAAMPLRQDSFDS